MFIEVSDGVAKTPKVGHTVKGLYSVLRQDQQSVTIQYEELDKTITADRVALASRQTGVPPIPQVSASSVDSQDKNMERTPWLLHGILDHYLNHGGQLEFLLTGVTLTRLH